MTRRMGISVVKGRPTLRLWPSCVAAVLFPFSGTVNSTAQQEPCTAGKNVVYITPSIFTGAELQLLSDEQLNVCCGYVDAVQASTMIGVTEHCRRALQTCVIGQGRADFVAAIRKYLPENPNRW